MQQQYESLVERDFPHNLVAILLFELIWAVGFGFAIYSVTVPAYLALVQAPKLLIGLVQSSFALTIFLQVVSSHYFGGTNRKKYVVWFHAAGGLTYVLAGGICLFWSPPLPRWLLVGFFSGCMFVFSALISLGTPLYVEVCADNAPKKRRGFLFSAIYMILGGTGLVFSFLSTYLFSHLDLVTGYHLRFLIAGILFSLSTLTVLFLRDHFNPVHRQHITRESFFQEVGYILLRILKDQHYAIFIFFYTVLVVAGNLGMSYLIPYAREKLLVSERILDLFPKMWLLSGLLFCVPAGRIGDRFGYRMVGIILSAGVLAGYLVCLLWHKPFFILTVYLPFSLCQQLAIMLLNNMGMELCPQIPPSKLFSISSLVPLPFNLALVSLAGRLIDVTDNYRTTFTIGAVLALVATSGFVTLVREPRHFVPEV